MVMATNSDGGDGGGDGDGGSDNGGGGVCVARGSVNDSGRREDQIGKWTGRALGGGG
jgi:hypothetical protein